MKATNINTDLEFGFITFEFAGVSLQACCDENGKINKSDSGIFWGLCGDNNYKALEAIGLNKEEHEDAMNAILRNAEESLKLEVN